jgi:hypothetical protein
VFLCTLGLVGAQYNANIQPRGETFNGQTVSRQFASQYSPVQPFGQSQGYVQPQQSIVQQQRPPYNNYQNQQQLAYLQAQNQPQYLSQQPVMNRVQPQQNYRPNYQQQQQPQRPFGPTLKPQLDQRFGENMQGDDPRNQGEMLATRRPPTKPVQTTDLPSPPEFPIRFDNFTQRKISWDGDLSKSAEEFSLTLFAYLESLNPDKSFMISPFSVHSLLTMIAEGANGNTYNQLNNALGLRSKERARDFHQYISTAIKYEISVKLFYLKLIFIIFRQRSSDVNLSLFSALIGDQNRPIGLEYEDIVEKVFDIDYIPVNFRDVENTINMVNNEVSQKTNGQIRQALSREELYKVVTSKKFQKIFGKI